jgi:signal transduction histidine kinase/ABC-type multidrug transport system ATPase subunit
MLATDATPAPPDAPVLRARSLSVSFGPLRALESVDLDIRPGEIVALAGENGAGKSTLVRCIAGEIRPDSGHIASPRKGVAVVWQDLALCDNLDIAANLLLGRETRRSLLSSNRSYRLAAELLAGLGIELPALTTPVGHLSGGQRQLVAVARALRDGPELVVLDEPTAALGVAESAQVEELTSRLPIAGTTVLLVTHDVDQMFRLADRIVVLRRGRLVAEVRPEESHPDDVAALLSGQPPDVTARSQLTRLRSLADQLASAEPSSSLTLILSALAAALGGAAVCIHEQEGAVLHLAGQVGLPPALAALWLTLPTGRAGGQVGTALESGREVRTHDIGRSGGWALHRRAAAGSGIQSAWSLPISASGITGVLTVLSGRLGPPTSDELALANVYSGYVAGALERDRLLSELRSRNRSLETIREMLEALAGPLPLDAGIATALAALRRGVGAEAVTLHAGPDQEGNRPVLGQAGGEAGSSGQPGRSMDIDTPEGPARLDVDWGGHEESADAEALMEGAANSLRLALEREASERAQRETLALRSSQELQRKFLSWLSHELRTPLTGIRGYASSLLQPDVDWDVDSQRRFLTRIADESSRLGRLVDDLLDFSAIDSGIMRLHPDWCDLNLVLEAARACLPMPEAQAVELATPPVPPVVWADHDRLEQVMVNLMENAIHHNPPGTRVSVEVSPESDGNVTITVTDDGVGVPDDLLGGPLSGPVERRSRSGRAGLGLSIAQGIVAGHGGRFVLEAARPGTRCVITIPVANGAPPDG